MRKKKIYFIICCLSSGGAERQLSGLANMLAPDYDITIVTWRDFDDHYPLDPSIKRVRISPYKGKYIKLANVMLHVLKCDADCVISYTEADSILSLIPLMLRPKVKSITSERNYKLGAGSFGEFLLHKVLYHRAKYIVPNNHAQSEYIRQTTKFGNKVRTITNYTDLSKYSFCELPDNQIIKIGVFARYAAQKNYKNFAKAVKRAKELCDIPFEIHWYGKKYGLNDTVNPGYAEFEKLIQGYGLIEVIYLNNHVPDVEIQMRKFDGIALLSQTEGFSNVIAEAICTGRPVIASDVSDNGVMVKDGYNGFLADPNDIDSMAQAIVKFVHTTSEQRIEMGKHSRELAESLFDKAAFKNKYIALIEN